jgi:CRP-like cAMP-binding protein
VESLTRFDIFADADPAALARWERSVVWRNVGDGELILDHGDEGDEVLIMVSGRARVVLLSEGGRRMTLTELGENEVFGELAAIDRKPRSASVFSAGPARVCVLSGDAFRDLATSSPKTALRMMALLSERIRTLNERHAEHTMLTAGQRLCAMLVRLSRPRAANPLQRIVSPPPTHEALSEMIGCRREVVSRELSSLAKSGVIERARGGLVLLKPEDLAARVSEAMSGRG